MPRLILSIVLSLLAGGALGARPSTLNMTCDQARGLVASHGAIVMTTGQYTFERFVATVRFCMFDEYADWAWAPTRDVEKCPVGYVCKTRPDFFEDFSFHD